MQNFFFLVSLFVRRTDHFEVCVLGYQFCVTAGSPSSAPPPPPSGPPKFFSTIGVYIQTGAPPDMTQGAILPWMGCNLFTAWWWVT